MTVPRIEGSAPQPNLATTYQPMEARSARSLPEDAGWWYEPKWEISVGAVPRSLRHPVKTALLLEGLPRVRQWLGEHSAATGQEGHAWIRVWYDAEQERLTYKVASQLR